MTDGKGSFDLAKKQLLANAPETALKEGEAALTAFGKAGDAKMQASIFREVMAPSHLKRHDLVRAAAALEAALDLLEGSGESEEEERTLLELAQVHDEALHFEDALEAASNVASRAAARGATREEGEARCLMARIQSRRGKLRVASATAKRACALLRQAGDGKKALDAMNIVMEVQVEEKRTEEAVQTAKECLPEALELKAYAQAAKCVQTLATARLQKQDFEGLVKSSQEAIQDLEKAEVDSGVAELRAQHWLAIGSARLEQLRGVAKLQDRRHIEMSMEALRASKEAVHDLEQVAEGDSSALSAAWLLLSKVHYVKEEAALAKRACTSAINLCKARGDLGGSAESLVLLAHCELLSLSREDQAPEDTKEALATAAAAAQEAKTIADKYEIREIQEMAAAALASVESAREAVQLAYEKVGLTKDTEDDEDEETLLDTRRQIPAKSPMTFDPRYALWLGAATERTFARRDVAMERLSALTALA